MMRLLIAAAGRLKAGPERALVETYVSRTEAAGKQLGFGPVGQVEIAESRQAQAEARKSEEASVLLGKIPDTHKIICLDPGGIQLGSDVFAARLAAYRDAGEAGLGFVIGAADGIGAALLDKATLSLSLGPMVLPHGLARVVLAEQLYRAMTILAGHPYHRG
jgi:23S rRNA (pseudouridine1915-N3)-methyltransferase